MLELKGYGYEVYGIDLDPEAVKIAKRRGLKVENLSIEDISLDNKRFDLIIAIALLEHLTEPLAFLQRVGSLLKETGKVILQYPNRDSLNARVSRLSKHSWDMYGEPGHVFFYSLENLKNMAQRVGLRLRETNTATILVRGKIPLLPVRMVALEERVIASCRRSSAFRKVYAGVIKLFDWLQLGDTRIVVLEK